MTVKENLQLSLRGFRYLFRLERTYAMMMVLTAVFKSLTPYVTIYMSARIIDELTGACNLRRLLLYALITIGLTLVMGFAQALTGRVRDYHLRILYDNEAAVFAEKTMELDYIRVESVETSLLREKIRVQSQTGYNLFCLYNSIEGAVASMVQIVSSLTLSAALLFSAGVPLLSRMLLITMLFVFMVINYYTVVCAQRIEHRLFGECVEFNNIGNYLTDHFGAYQSGMEIRLYHMEGLISSQFREFNRSCDRLIYGAQRQTLKYTFLSEFLLHALKLAVYAAVIAGALSGNLTVGEIAKYVSCMVLLAEGSQGLIKAVRTLIENNKYLRTYFSFLDIPSEMRRGTLPVEKRAFCAEGDNDYEIEFRNVSFRYPGSEQYALKNLSLKFRVGERMALVGQNGSGKTTFIKLLCRLYDPTEGSILLNGIDIRKYKYEEYLSLFSVVFQDFKLFAFSLGQNVSGAVRYDREKAKQCLEKAGFAPGKMAEGLDTCLYKEFDRDGVEISGGEAQKIALARALYKDAPFVVLDEPTAALDPIAEYEVYSRFHEIAGEKTTVFISHRLSSCRFCDDIAVFHEGRLVQRGNHTRLLQDCDGKYAELWNAQAQYYERGSGR